MSCLLFCGCGSLTRHNTRPIAKMRITSLWFSGDDHDQAVSEAKALCCISVGDELFEHN